MELPKLFPRALEVAKPVEPGPTTVFSEEIQVDRIGRGGGLTSGFRSDQFDLRGPTKFSAKNFHE